MKKKELIQLRKKSVKDLTVEAQKLREELSKAHIELAVGNVKNVRQVKNLRRDLAQILTILREKQIEAEILQEKGK